jgi:hypothetical protein
MRCEEIISRLLCLDPLFRLRSIASSVAPLGDLNSQRIPLISVSGGAHSFDVNRFDEFYGISGFG